MSAAVLFKQAFSGSVFGASLTVAGVWVPSVILDQMRMQDSRMVQLFLTASGTSTLLLAALNGSGYTNALPRSPSPIAGLGRYAGNVTGGLMQGAGMALAGACATTVVMQASVGIYPGLYTVAGAAIGGFLYVPINGWIQHWNADAKAKFNEEPAHTSSRSRSSVKTVIPEPAPPALTVNEQLGVDRTTCILALEGACAAAVAALVYYPSQQRGGISQALADKAFLNPVLAGLLVSAAQATAVFVRGTPLGVSNFFEEVGHIMWAGVDLALSYIPGTAAHEEAQQGQSQMKDLSFSGVAFASGMVAASVVLIKFVLPDQPHGHVLEALLDFSNEAEARALISPLQAIGGGVLLGLGSRISGGCTSGHGISGVSLLSTSSLVTTVCMAAGGVGCAQLL